jgi:hypothetical protein
VPSIHKLVEAMRENQQNVAYNDLYKEGYSRRLMRLAATGVST